MSIYNVELLSSLILFPSLLRVRPIFRMVISVLRLGTSKCQRYGVVDTTLAWGGLGFRSSIDQDIFERHAVLREGIY